MFYLLYQPAMPNPMPYAPGYGLPGTHEIPPSPHTMYAGGFIGGGGHTPQTLPMWLQVDPLGCPLLHHPWRESNLKIICILLTLTPVTWSFNAH